MKGNAGGVVAAVFEEVEGGMRKTWYLVHFFTFVFLIRILFIIIRLFGGGGGICKSYFLFYFIHSFPI